MTLHHSRPTFEVFTKTYLQNMYSLLYFPYPLPLWVIAMFTALALEPSLPGFSVYIENWRR
jgi:hypothetical protein